MKNYLKIIAVMLLITSCQSNKKEAVSSSAAIEKEYKSEQNDMDSPKDVQTELEFGDFFPKHIGDYRLIEVSVATVLSRTFTTASYLKGDNMKNSIAYSIEDCNKKGSSSVIRDFETYYKYQNKGEGDTENIFKERNGYKTFAFIIPKENYNETQFIYKQRFSIVLRGPEHPDKLWSYVKEEDLKKLDNY